MPRNVIDRQTKLTNQLYKLSLVGFGVMVVWIVAEIYWTYITSQQNESDLFVVTPISNNVYLDLATELSARQPLEVVEESETPSLLEEDDQTGAVLFEDLFAPETEFTN